MYVPRFNTMDDADEIRRLVAAVGSAELVTVGPDGYPAATLLPVVWEGDRLVLHMARANPHWKSIEAGSPRWRSSPDRRPTSRPRGTPRRPSTAASYRPGTTPPSTSPAGSRSTTTRVGARRRVTRLTDLNEQRRELPWAVDDAPERYVEKQLRAIVGIELAIERVEGKAKLSQNRSEEDRAGVVEGLRGEGGAREHEVADLMEPATRRRLNRPGPLRTSRQRTTKGYPMSTSRTLDPESDRAPALPPDWSSPPTGTADAPPQHAVADGRCRRTSTCPTASSPRASPSAAARGPTSARGPTATSTPPTCAPARAA